MNKISEHAKRLVACASDDQTRPQLCAIHHKHGWYFSTDGCRAYFVKASELHTGENIIPDGKSCDVDSFKVGAFKDVHHFQSWEALIIQVGRIDTHRHIGTLNVPAWFGDLKPRKRWKPGTIPTMHLDSDCHFTTNPKHALVAFNAWLMRPFAGEQVQITLSDGASGPIILSPETGKSFLDQDWFALIMPMRMKK